MFHFLTRMKDYTYRKQILRKSDFEVTYVGSANIANFNGKIFSYRR
jgi:hypothetical protein